MSSKIIPLFIPFMGCRHKCTYCNQTAITGITAANILSSLKEQLHIWKQRLPHADEVAFYGGTFTRLEPEIRKSLYSLASGLPVRVSTCPDSIDSRFIEEIRDYNISTVELGVQSLSEKVLRNNRREYSSAHVIEIFNMLNPVVKTSAQMMTGMYTETAGDVFKTSQMLELLKPAYSRIYPVIVLPGTELEQLYSDGKYAPLSPGETVIRTACYYIALNACESKVIRIGLPPEVNSGIITAGFWHPALGDVVKTFVIALYCTIYGKRPFIEYGGYKKFLSLNYKHFAFDDLHLSMQDICKKIMESGIESQQWFFEKQIIDIATRLIG